MEQKYVFPVGMFEGRSKPKDITSFLHRLVIETNLLTSCGISVKNSTINVHLRLFIFDTPARALILNIKNAPGYFSCHRCTVRGIRMEGVRTACFGNDFDAILRTHDDFVCKTFYSEVKTESHHLSEETTILELLDNFDIVQQTTVDFMHVACLGAMKRIIEVLLKYHENFGKVSNIFLKISAAFIPMEFARKCRLLDFLKQYKATEYRFWLMFFAPISLQASVPTEEFLNFCHLFHGLRLLYEPISSRSVKTSELCIARFLDKWKTFYPQQNVTYVLHALKHIPMDCFNFKSNPDDLSAFPFESYLRRVKDNYHKGRLALEQVGYELRLCDYLILSFLLYLRILYTTLNIKISCTKKIG